MAGAGAFGPNAWLVEDMYDRFLADPTSVSDSWREFFADYRSAGAPAPVTAPPSAVPALSHGDARRGRPAPREGTDGGQRIHRHHPPTGRRHPTDPVRTGPVLSGPAPGAEAGDGATPLRGAAGRIVANMEASLGVPTATSVRVAPAKLLEVNRVIVNNQLFRTTGGKVSFTHLIGYAVVKGLRAVPAMNATFVADADGKGTPGVVRHRHVGLGLAVDVEKSPGQPDAAGPLHHRRRHPRLPDLRRGLRGPGPQDPHQQDRPRTTSPAPR